MNNLLTKLMSGVEVFFVLYLLIYSSYLFVAVITGAWRLYKSNRMFMLHNILKHEYYIPVSIIVPAYNEEVNIIENVKSLLKLDYKLYEIIIIDDGSNDNTANKLIKEFDLKFVNRPIQISIKCKPYSAVYERNIGKIKLTMIMKTNGGKGDALNMGINASQFPYFLSVDADSNLQYDSLEKIIQPVLKEENVVAVGGLISVAQAAIIKDGVVKEYHLPWNPIISMQIVEYDRSFLASRILLNEFNGNLIISGAFGLFKKSVVLSAGGYDTGTIGEDMEMVLKLHTYCRNNSIKYKIEYEPSAVCWSQAPSTLKDLITQRRRWYLGLFQSLSKYSTIFFRNMRFGMVSFISYLYYFFFELLSPIIEIFGIVTILISLSFGFLNPVFMIKLFLLYGLYGGFLTLTAFFQRVYSENRKINLLDVIKAIIMCLLEALFFRYILSFIRVTAFIGYNKKKMQWGTIKRIEKKV